MAALSEIEEQADKMMLGVGCYQQPDRTWIAKSGAWPTKCGMGTTHDAALASLRKKIVSQLKWRATKRFALGQDGAA